MRIALAAGDGIGPEIMAATLTLMDAAGVMKAVEFVPVEMGKSVFESGNTRGMPEQAIRTVEDCGILFKGPMETPKGGGGKSINVTARKIWSAYANYRHFRSLPGVQTPFSHLALDFAIVRENVEDTYGGIEHRLAVEGERPGAGDHRGAAAEQFAQSGRVLDRDRPGRGIGVERGGEIGQSGRVPAGEYEVGPGAIELPGDEPPGEAGRAVDRDRAALSGGEIQGGPSLA